jgi:methylenetetrahydrofolate dehydrogenase (NADP+)/methenyltetrahydrofolate cyclohydrolase
MTAKIIDGKKIAEIIKKNLSKEIKLLKDKYNITPNFTTIKIGSDPSSDLYLKLRDRACNEVGIKSSLVEFPDTISEEGIINSIMELNKDNSVHGILIQFPIPNHISEDNLINSLNPKKDIEGLTPYNMGKTLIGNEQIIPCTPLSVLTILDHENTDLKGKDIVIVNHSKIVGKPLAALFLNRNATVSVCHVFSKDLKKYSVDADILVTAAGVPKLIKKDYVKENAFVIDVAVIKTKDGITGDVDFKEVKDIAGKLTPVPGGVGPVTVASSLKNMIKVICNFVEEK